MQTLREQLANPEKDKLSLEQFLNLIKQIATKVKSGDAVKKDSIYRLVFLNLRIGIDNVASYQAKPLYEMFLKVHQIPLSRGERTCSTKWCLHNSASRSQSARSTIYEVN